MALASGDCRAECNLTVLPNKSSLKFQLVVMALCPANQTSSWSLSRTHQSPLLKSCTVTNNQQTTIQQSLKCQKSSKIIFSPLGCTYDALQMSHLAVLYHHLLGAILYWGNRQ